MSARPQTYSYGNVMCRACKHHHFAVIADPLDPDLDRYDRLHIAECRRPLCGLEACQWFDRMSRRTTKEDAIAGLEAHLKTLPESFR